SNAVDIQQIQVRVLPPEDPQPPQVIIPSLKVGVRAGTGASTTILDSLVIDPDTPIELLSWSSSSLSLARIDPAALDSRRLEVSASPDSVGYVPVTLKVTDPTLLVDSLAVRIYVSSPITGIPVAGGLPDLIIETGKSGQLDLDGFYFDTDHTDAEVVWSGFGQEQIVVDIDLLTHLTTFQVPETATNEFEEIVFTVLDPDGNFASDTMRVTIVHPGSVVLDLGVIGGQKTVTLGIPDTLALRPLIRIGAPQNIVWSALSRDATKVFSQVLTDQLLLIGVQLGNSQVVLTATDKTTGNSSVDSLVVNVVPESGTDAPLMLKDIGPLNLTAEQDTTIDLKTLVISGNTATIVWTVQPNPNVGVEIDSLNQVAILRPTPGFQGSAGAILFQARDVFSDQEAVSVATPVQVTGNFLVGGELLQILLIHNPIRTNFFDVFIRSRRDLLSAPFLGFLLGEDPTANPTAIPVNEVDNVQNMWFGSLVLSNDIVGLVELSATGIAKDSRVGLTDTLRLQIERAQVRSTFSITYGDVTVSLPQDGVTSTSVVALYAEPEVDRAGRSKPVLDGLTPVSEVYRVYAPWAKVKREGEIRFEQAGPSDPSIGIYRQDEATEKWQFAGSRRVGSQIEGAFSAFGRYRLLADAVAPVAGDVDVLEAEGALSISLEDVGSGVDPESVLLTVNGTPVDVSFDPAHHRVVWTPRGVWDGVDQMLRLRLTDLAGNETVWERRIDLQTLMPQATQFQLEQNFPNPFNPETTIRFDVPGAVDFRLVIYNLLGQEIRTLMAGRFEAGRYTVSWDATDDLGRQIAAGMYLYRLEARDVVLTRKMVLVK
ncbi:MAG: T9SS type A sorting domain-containing protein, partial [bacterium]|nr:T9SS type A sorting domain-containing protein [bacterium]